MTTATNLAFRQNFFPNSWGFMNDELTATAGGGQNVGPRLVSGMNRFTVVASAGDSAQLPSILSGETKGHVVVINDTAASMNVFPATGENMNGAANASAAVPANSVAFFMLVPGATNWRSATL